MSLGETWVVCKENTTQSLKTSWKEFIKCPCQDQLQWSIQCTFGRYFVWLETARWELYLRFYDLCFNSWFGSLHNIYIYICTYIMYINIHLCGTMFVKPPAVVYHLWIFGWDMALTWDSCAAGPTGPKLGEIFFWERTMSKQQITEIMVYNKTPERKNWPFLLGG